MDILKANVHGFLHDITGKVEEAMDETYKHNGVGSVLDRAVVVCFTYLKRR